MKNTFFSPTRQRFVASNTNCLVQFLRGHLGSPDETDLDTAHQTEMAPFRKPKTANNFDPRSSFCAEPIFFMFLIAFGIVGSVEARVRSILKTHEKQLELLRADIARCEQKLDRLSGSGGQ